jgi:hypothetical protein
LQLRELPNDRPLLSVQRTHDAGDARMSRAVNVQGTESEIKAVCNGLGIAFSVLEPLKSGGMRLVLNNSTDALAVRAKMKTKLISGPVERSPSHVSRPHIPYR